MQIEMLHSKTSVAMVQVAGFRQVESMTKKSGPKQKTLDLVSQPPRSIIPSEQQRGPPRDMF
jgi:hypothetical protein